QIHSGRPRHRSLLQPAEAVDEAGGAPDAASGQARRREGRHGVTVSLQLYRFFFAGPPWVRRFQSRHAYQAMSRNLSNYVPKEREKIRTDPMVIASSFLNYGYEDLDANAPRPALRESDHPRRHSIQLYDHVVAGIPLEGKDVLEVSSGRGGGCRYIHETFGPRSVTGLDLSEASIEFSRLVNENADVQFRCGDAEAMPFADDSF